MKRTQYRLPQAVTFLTAMGMRGNVNGGEFSTPESSAGAHHEVGVTFRHSVLDMCRFEINYK